MWALRRPAAAFAAGMTAAFLLVASLGAVQVYQRDIERERAETDQVRTEAQAARHTLDLLTIQRLRQPTRQMDWFAIAWERLRSFRGGAHLSIPSFRVRPPRHWKGSTPRSRRRCLAGRGVVQFDPHSERLLINRSGKDAQGATWTRTTLWNLTTDQAVVERNLGQGVLAFQTDETPLQLSWVRGQRAESFPCRELVLAKIAPKSTRVKSANAFDLLSKAYPTFDRSRFPARVRTWPRRHGRFVRRATKPPLREMCPQSPFGTWIPSGKAISRSRSEF